MDHFYGNGHRLNVQFLFSKTSKFKTSVARVPCNKLLTNLAALSLRGGAAVHRLRPVPRICCQRGQTPQTFTGISRIQTGFLVKHYVRKKKVFLAGATAPPAPPAMYGPEATSHTGEYWHLFSFVGNLGPIFPRGLKCINLI